jgi:DNA-binding transcriptional regulator YiaG
MTRICNLTEKPRGKFSTPAACRQAREYLGLNKTELARLMRFGTNGRETVRRIEQGQTQGPPGPYQLALEAMVSGWRPWGVKLPNDEGKNDG